MELVFKLNETDPSALFSSSGHLQSSRCLPGSKVGCLFEGWGETKGEPGVTTYHSGRACADIKEEAVLTASSEQSRLSCHHVFSCSTVSQTGGAGWVGGCVCVCVCIRIIGECEGDRAYAWGSFSTDNEKDHRMKSSRHRNLSARGGVKRKRSTGDGRRCLSAGWGLRGTFFMCGAWKTRFLRYKDCGLRVMRAMDAGRENFTGDFIRNDYLTWYWSDACLLRGWTEATLPSNTFGLVPLRPVPWCT